MWLTLTDQNIDKCRLWNTNYDLYLKFSPTMHKYEGIVVCRSKVCFINMVSMKAC